MKLNDRDTALLETVKRGAKIYRVETRFAAQMYSSVYRYIALCRLTPDKRGTGGHWKKVEEFYGHRGNGTLHLPETFRDHKIGAIWSE